MDSNAEARALSASLARDGIAAKTIGQTSSVTVQGDLAPAAAWSKAIKILKGIPGAWKWSVKVATEAYKLGKDKGVAYLRKHISALSSWNPIKWGWKAILSFAGDVNDLWAIIEFIVHHV
ncbi:hypothetical protein [Streptomyces sioyaensis]|uniref:hypothetical protein n=1 Tax=Streptomyces sioyaensis TaxID=67364 RepID=UPI0037991C74